MMRTQPPGFRWLVGGFALIAAVAFGVRYHSSGDRAVLVLGALCLVAAGYWLIFDREPAGDDPPLGGSERDGFEPDHFERDGFERDGFERDGFEPDRRG